MRQLTLPLFAIAIMAATLSNGTFAASGIQDDAHFFSASAVEGVNQRLKTIEQKYHHSVMIETKAEIPADKRSQYSEANKNQFYASWLRDQARANHIDGLYVLITRNPSHLQVGVGQQLARIGFSNDERDRVRDALTSSFKRKQYDDGLFEAISIVESTLDEKSRTFSTGASNAPAPVRREPRALPAPSPGSVPTPRAPGLSWFTWLLLIGGGFLLLRFVMKAFMRPAYTGNASGQVPYGTGTAPGYGGAPGGPGGGGFMSGMLGGLLGGAAGNWAANRWFGHGQEPNHPDANISSEGHEPERGFDTSTGADFGGPADTGGGGDFGGSDAGPSDGGGSSGGDF